MKALIPYPNFKVNYSAKANTNLHLLKIARDEGLMVDAMSPGEIHIELKAGFKPNEILFISNNVSASEMQYAIDRDILVSVDSLSQLDQYGKLNKGGKVAIRINPGVGAGHHEKVVTAGVNTKFGIDPGQIDEINELIVKHSLKIVGINQHIGSLFMDSKPYIEAAGFLLSFAENFPGIEFIDFGGGFGVPYNKGNGETALDLKELGIQLQALIDQWLEKGNPGITMKVEPGRFMVAECGILLGEVHSVKENFGKKYIGTDIGFNVLGRPMIYNAHHDIEVYKKARPDYPSREKVTLVGNICETGDILARDRELAAINEKDLIGMLDSGAYGMVMSSNYNCRLRPAEVLIDKDGKDKLIRKREELDDLIKHF
jgi:diaminopimelate decarboxylase